MTPDATILAVLSAVAFLFFVWGRYPGEIVALFLLASLLIFGLITPQEAFSGFSHPAVILVASFLVISEALVKTGAVGILSRAIFRTHAPRRILTMLISVVSGSSAWISNTALTALFIPLVRELSRDKGIVPSKFLIPLSYASVIGGTFTVIGSSTNLFAVSLYAEFTQGRTIPIFALLPFALVFFAVFVFYMVFFGFRHLPAIAPEEELSANVDLRDFLLEARIMEGSPLIGRAADSEYLRNTHDLDVVALERRGRRYFEVPAQWSLREGDRVLFRGEVDAVAPLARLLKLKLESDLTLQKAGYASGDVEYTDVIIGPNSRYINSKVSQVGIFQRTGATVLAVCRRGRERRRRVRDTLLRFGDILIIQGPKGSAEAISKSKDFIFRKTIQMAVERRSRLPFAALTLIGVLAAGISGVFSLPAAAFIGALFVILVGCLTPREMRSTISLHVLLLLAALIPYAIVFERSGLADGLAEMVVATGGRFGPRGAFFLVMIAGSALGHLIHPNGVLAVMMPIAVATSRALGVDSIPFAIGTIYASIYVFASPYSYNTNAMVMAEGRYTLGHFVRAGLPLVFAFHLLAWLVIPLFFPF